MLAILSNCLFGLTSFTKERKNQKNLLESRSYVRRVCLYLKNDLRGRWLHLFTRKLASDQARFRYK